MSKAVITPVWVRLTHWINAGAVVLMVMSGEQVYDASPIFPALQFPANLTLGNWLGGALLWHFAVAWLLLLNFLTYLALNSVSGRLRRKLMSLDVRSLVSDFAAAITGKLRHDDLANYNAVQKAAYLLAIADIALLILSGLAVWKPIQLSLLCDLLGGYDTARRIHFIAMSVMVGFFALHVVMVVLVPRSLLLITRGR